MKNDNFKENKVIKRIYDLRKDYEFRHLFSGTYLGHNVKCDCCEDLTGSVENLYYKKEQNKIISICANCSNLWRELPII
jgi:hypothetical protein